jgi:hypothetical protein
MNTNIKKVVRLTGFSIFFVLLLVYAFFRSRDLILGVKIKNVSLKEGAYQEQVLNVAGNAKNAIKLSLNGRSITMNQAGDWNEAIALLPGYNVVSIKAEDKFGYVDEKNYKLMYKKDEKRSN